MTMLRLRRQTRIDLIAAFVVKVKLTGMSLDRSVSFEIMPCILLLYGTT